MGIGYFDMNLDLTKEDTMIRDAARKFADEVVRPTAIELDKMTPEETIAPGSPLWGYIKTAWKLGYHKTGFPQELGGLGFTPLQMHILQEELQCAAFGLGSVVFLSQWGYAKVLMSGRQDLIEKYVIPYCKSDDGSMTGCWAIVEPDRGSDNFSQGEPYYRDPNITLGTKARLDGNEWVINGQKAAWISCGPTATHCMLNVQVDNSMGMAGGGVCFLPLNLPGVSRGLLKKSGQRDIPQGELYFDDARIPKEDMFVYPEEYPEWVLNNLAFGNTGVATAGAAMARAGFEEALKYAKEKIQGGKFLIEHPSIRAKLHRMFAKVEAARAFTRALVAMHGRIYPWLAEYALAAKIFCTETAREVVDEAVQIHGACGVSSEYHIEKLFRDVRAFTILDGENETLARVGGHILKETFPRTTVNKLF